MAHCTRFTLLPEFSPPEVDIAESSSGAALPDLSDEPPHYTENSEDNGDNLISTGSSIHTPLEKKGKKYDLGISFRKGDHKERKVDSCDDGAHKRVKLLVDEFMQTHPSPPYCEHAVTGNLPCPVIIPQRRPRDWKRGFMRAYAPVLADNGISQETFMDFLKTFHAVNKYLPWYYCINAAVTNLIPIPFVNCAVNIAIDFAIESRARSRSNGFINRMNEEFFKPRGLYCLVMAYDPKSGEAHTPVNITRCVSSSMKSSPSGFPLAPLTSNRSHSLELPECAPLVFPILESQDPLFHPFKWTQKSVSNYCDRREQTEYVRKSPPKALTPMAPSNQLFGGPESWLSGDSINPIPTGEGIDAVESKTQVMSDKEQGGVDAVESKTQVMSDKEPREKKKSKKKKEKEKVKSNKGTGRRWFKEDVLYLMIVNLPTDAELEAVRQSYHSKLMGD